MNIRLVTRDGVLVGNRVSNYPEWYWSAGSTARFNRHSGYGRDTETREMLTYECQLKGVKLISFEYETYKGQIISIQALVEWC